MQSRAEKQLWLLSEERRESRFGNWKDYSVKFNRHNEQYQEHATFMDETFPTNAGAGAEGRLRTTEVNGFLWAEAMFSVTKWSEAMQCIYLKNNNNNKNSI